MFRPGTWRWAAVTTQGRVLSRERGCTVAEAEAEGLSHFLVQPVTQIGRMMLSRSGKVAGRELGLICERKGISLRPGMRLRGITFTRRRLIVGTQVGEEILVRYTWLPTGQRILVHFRPGVILVDEVQA